MERMEPQYNPFNYGIPVSGQYFVGRWEQVKAMAYDLANPRGHSFALIGGRRFGKSSFLEALQGELMQKLASTKLGEWYVFPVLISLKSLQEHSSGGVFALMLRMLHEYFSSPLTRRKLGLALQIGMEQTKLAAFAQSNDQTCSQERFANILEEIIILFENTHGSFRPVFLLDETEEILDQTWTEEIFSQLRSIIYVGKLRDYVRYVLAGSSKIIEVREKGSPLLNMLNIIYLEAIDDTAIRRIIGWADHIQEDFAHEMLQQCGGHPYLAQFLMYHAWDALREGMPPEISRLVNIFRSKAHGSLEQWQTDLGKASLITYQILADANAWLSEAQIKQQVQDESLIADIGTALINLCYHGFVQQRGTWYEYRVEGQLFNDWFNDKIRPTLHAPIILSETPPTQPVPENPSIDTAKNKPPTITIQLPTPAPPSYPTAYYDVLTKNGFPFISCEIDNTHPDCTNARISVEVTIQGFSETDSDTVIVASGRSEKIFLLPRLTREKALSLTNTKIASCHVLVKRLLTLHEEILYNKTYEIQLLSYSTALYAIKDPFGNLAQDLADYLAVFVTPYQQEIVDFVGEATGEHPDKAFIGYRACVTGNTSRMDDNKARNALRKQAEAFFVALQKRGLRYVFSPNSFGNQLNQVTQHIRLPSESLPKIQGQKGQASCLDSTVLFASLLESIGIEPLIILIPGHAFVGWRVFPGSEKYDFLETTMIGEATWLGQHTFTFNEALAQGHKRYQDAKQSGNEHYPFLDSRGFLRIVDIAECRGNNINPLS